MPFVLELPPQLETRLRAEADAQGRDLASVVADRILASFAATDQVVPMRAFSAYISETGYIADARQKAPLFAISPKDAAAMAEGVADIESGRTMSLSECLVAQKAAREARERNATV